MAGLAAVVSTPFAAWWLIGDLSERRVGRHPLPLDYVVRAPKIPGRITATLGAIALAVAATSVAIVVVAVRQRRLDQRCLSVVGSLLLAGIVAAWIARVVTAGTRGANIGAGLAVVLGAPVIVGLVVLAALSSMAIRRRKIHVPLAVMHDGAEPFETG
jgi:hypothetical protein